MSEPGSTGAGTGRETESGVADLEPGNEQAAALQGTSTTGAPGSSDTPDQESVPGASGTNSPDDLAPGRSILDPGSPDVEPNEPA